MISYQLLESGALHEEAMTSPVSSLRARNRPYGAEKSIMNLPKKARHCERSEAIWELQSRSQSDRETLLHQIASSPSAPRNDGLSCVFSNLYINFIKKKTVLGFVLFTALQIMTFLATPPAYAQGFENLMNELSGSEVDQVESEVVEKESEEAKLTPPPSSTEITSTTDDVDFETEKNIVTNGVTLQGLDKQTARVFIINAAIGQTVEFGTLKIMVQHCEKAPVDDHQESIAFVRIIEAKPNSNQQKLFSGWMFSSSPALSALDHPTYDVWIKECKVLDE